MVSVFTPTHNRAVLLERLYASLVSQTCMEFEWIIVDDGSTDNTGILVEQFIKSNQKFPIKYLSQHNQGKHIAINRGAMAAEGELFYMVDSDDYLSADAIYSISEQWKPLRHNYKFAGLCYNKRNLTGQTIGRPGYNILDTDPLSFRYIYNEKGDKAEVIRTILFRCYPFPSTPGELFCPEGLFFLQLGDYYLRYINEDIHNCEYLSDGLSARIFNIRMVSPINTCIYYSRLANSNIPYKYKLKAAINFYRFSRYIKDFHQYFIKMDFFSLRLARALAFLIYSIYDSKK